MGQVVGALCVDVDDASALDGIDDGSVDLVRKGRASETASQASAVADDSGVGVGCSVHHDGALTGIVVDAFLESFEDEGVSVASLVGVFGEVESEGTLVGSLFIGEGGGVVVAAVLAVGYHRREEEFVLLHIEHIEPLFGGGFREIDEGEYLALAVGDFLVAFDGQTECFGVDFPIELHLAVELRRERGVQGGGGSRCGIVGFAGKGEGQQQEGEYEFMHDFFLPVLKNCAKVGLITQIAHIQIVKISGWG